MSDLCRLIWCALIGLFRPRAALEAENLVLRHQLNVLRRKSPKRLAFGNVDRFVFTAFYRVAPGLLDAVPTAKSKQLTATANRLILAADERCLQVDLVRLGRTVPAAAALEAEILVLRHQLNVLRRKSPRRVAFSNVDRLVFTALYRVAHHVVVFGERHLRHLLNSYQKYYNEARTHLSLHKDAPIPRGVQTIGRTLAVPVLGGLHHRYFRA
jgi:hypothetical protein